MGTWQWMILANNQGLIDGGRGGLFWSYIWTYIGYGFLGASLADMASMAPTAGGGHRSCVLLANVLANGHRSIPLGF